MSVIEQLNRKSQYSNTTAIDTFLVLHFKEATQVDAGIDIFLNRLNVFNWGDLLRSVPHIKNGLKIN